jgi:hypothetical protein
MSALVQGVPAQAHAQALRRRARWFRGAWSSATYLGFGLARRLDDVHRDRHRQPAGRRHPGRPIQSLVSNAAEAQRTGPDHAGSVAS